MFNPCGSANPSFSVFASSQTTGKNFTMQGLIDISIRYGIGRNMKPVIGNKSILKRPFKFFIWTWGEEDIGFKRDRIENLNFRRLFRNAYNVLAGNGNPHATPDRLWEILAYRFFKQHAVLLYPDSNGSLSQMSKKTSSAASHRVLLCFEPLRPTTVVPRSLD